MVAWSPALAQAADGQAADAQAANGARHLLLTTQVNTTYDSNVARSAPGEAEALHLVQGDVYVQPSVAIDGLLPVGREALFLTGLVGYNFYDRDTSLNSEHIDLLGGMSAQLFRCQPRLTGNYARVQTALEQLLPGPGGANTSPQNVSTVAGVGFDLSCPGAQGLSPTVSVSHSTYENDNKTYKFANNTSTSVSFGLAYARAGFGTIETYGSFSSVAYDNPFPIPFPPFEIKNSYDLYAGGVRYARPIGSRLSGKVSISYSSLRPSVSFDPGFSGVTYSGELSYNMSSRLTVHGMVSRATLPSTQVGVAYVIENPRQIDLNYKMGPRLTWTVAASDKAQSYPHDLDGEIPNLVTNAHIDSVFGSANLALNRRLSISLAAATEHRSANLALYSYVDNRVSLTLKSVF